MSVVKQKVAKKQSVSESRLKKLRSKFYGDFEDADRWSVETALRLFEEGHLEADETLAIIARIDLARRPLVVLNGLFPGPNPSGNLIGRGMPASAMPK